MENAMRLFAIAACAAFLFSSGGAPSACAVQSAVPDVNTDVPVANLAVNRELAEVDRIELRAVQAHKARLHSVLDVLQKQDADVSKELAGLHTEMVAQDHEIDWQMFLFTTAGLGQVLKSASVNAVQQAEAIKQDSIWAEIPVEKAQLQTMLGSAKGRDAEALKETIDAYDRVERTHRVANNVEAATQLREVMLLERAEMEHLSSLNPKTADLLYESSALMGRIAIIFGKGIVGELSTGAAFAEPFTEASAVYAMMRQEEQQMGQLAGGLADRQTLRRQIHEQLGDLEAREQTLEWAIQRATPTPSTPVSYVAPGGQANSSDDRTTIRTLLDENKEITTNLAKIQADAARIAKAKRELEGVNVVLVHAARAVKETENGIEDEVNKLLSAENNGCPWGGKTEDAAYAAACNQEMARIKARFSEAQSKQDRLVEDATTLAEEQKRLSDKTVELAAKEKRNIADRALFDDLSAKWTRRYNAFVFHSEAYEHLKKMEPQSQVCESTPSLDEAAKCLMRLWDGAR